MQDYTRKGFIDGRSVRVPTATVRPGTPNGAASGFASGIIREPLSGVEAVLPVPAETAMWVASPRAIVGMFLHALKLSPKDWGWHRSINLPGFVVTMTQELETLRQVGGDAAVALVKHQPDAQVQKLVSTWAARFDTARATAMGFQADSDFAGIVQGLRGGQPRGGAGAGPHLGSAPARALLRREVGSRPAGRGACGSAGCRGCRARRRCPRHRS